MGHGNFGHQSAGERRPELRSHAQRFAAAIAARHAPVSAPAPRVPRIGLRPPATRPASSGTLRLDVRVGQRVELLLTRLEHRTSHRVVRTVANGAGAAVRMVERIVSRSRRADGGSPAAAPVPGPAAPAVPEWTPAVRAALPPRPTPVRRVVRHSPAPDPALPATAAPRPTPKPPAAVIGAAELERVTSHVVATLDRRVSAWRERTGRV